MRYGFVSLLLLVSTVAASQDAAYQSLSVDRISFTKAVLSGKVFSLKRQKGVDSTAIKQSADSGLLTIGEVTSNPPIEYLLKIEHQREACADLLEECHNSFKTDAEASIFFSKMGWNYLSEGKRKEARDRFDWAYLLDENNTDAFWGLGVMTFQEGRLGESTLFMERGLKVSKEKNVTLMVDLATVYISLFTQVERPRHLNRAFELLEKAIEINPKFANAYMQKALAELVNGKSENAWINFHKSYDLAPNEVDKTILTALLSQKPDPKGVFK